MPWIQQSRMASPRLSSKGVFIPAAEADPFRPGTCARRARVELGVAAEHCGRASAIKLDEGWCAWRVGREEIDSKALTTSGNWRHTGKELDLVHDRQRRDANHATRQIADDIVKVAEVVDARDPARIGGTCPRHRREDDY